MKDASGIAYYLAHTVAIEGSLGFSAVVNDPTHEELMQFIYGVGYADPELMSAYDDELARLISATNDPDLLPPEEIDEKKETTPPSVKDE